MKRQGETNRGKRVGSGAGSSPKFRALDWHDGELSDEVDLHEERRDNLPPAQNFR